MRASGVVGGLFLTAVAGCAAAAPSNASLVASAASAAPPAVGRYATVIRMDAKGGMVVLRKGTNGWTCMPDDPRTPGQDPMCFDANGMAWLNALIAHRPPAADRPGLAYMLRGGADASNLDPFMTSPAPGDKWVMTGPHVMILSAVAAKASGFPSGQRAPDTSKPYVMFGGTPYAHIMLPVQ